MGCSFPQGRATTITRMLQIRHILASLLALGAVCSRGVAFSAREVTARGATVRDIVIIARAFARDRSTRRARVVVCRRVASEEECCTVVRDRCKRQTVTS